MQCIAIGMVAACASAPKELGSAIALSDGVIRQFPARF
jgi:hypothetical protein